MKRHSITNSEQAVLDAARELMLMRLYSRRPNGRSVDPVEQKALVKYLEMQLINRALALPDEPVPS